MSPRGDDLCQEDSMKLSVWFVILTYAEEHGRNLLLFEPVIPALSRPIGLPAK